ncbi:hypothetical protein G6F40_017860 [Rhizopus arrhizus]|nr:hypothetical protein G6F40_017860 [Rhizopus arrhizus]
MGRQHAEKAGLGTGSRRHGPVFHHDAGQRRQHHPGVRFRALPGQSRQLSVAAVFGRAIDGRARRVKYRVSRTESAAL